METTGKNWVIGISAYLILKSILNLILGFSASNVVMLIVMIVAAVLMLRKIPFVQYILALLLVILFLSNFWNNVTHLGSNWLYFIEGILDVGCAAVLVFEKNVRAFFKK